MATEHALSRLWRLDMSVAVFAGGLLYALYAARAIPFDVGDEGYVLYIAQQLARGARLYRDIELFNYMPGVFYLFVPFVRVFQSDAQTLHAALAVPLAACAWLVYRIVADRAGKMAGFATAVLFIAAPGDWHRFYIAALNLALLFCALHYVGGEDERWLAALGAVTGAAFCVRIDAAIAGVALLAVCVPLAPTTKASARALRFGIAGLVAAFVVAMLLLAFENVLADYLRQLAAMPRGLMARATADYQSSPPTLRQAWWGSTFARIYYASLLVPIAAAAMLIDRTATREWRATWLIVSVWLAFNLPQFVFERPDWTHLSHRTYALLVPAAIFIAHAAPLRRSLLTPYRFALSALALALVVVGGTAFAKLMQESPGAVGMLLMPHDRTCLDNGVCYVDREPSLVPQRLMNDALAKLGGDEPIAVVPYGPGFAYLLEHRLPGRQIYLLPHSITSDTSEATFIDALRRVRLVIYDRTFRYSRSDATTVAHYAPHVERYLRTCFVAVDEQGSWSMLERTRRDKPCEEQAAP